MNESFYRKEENFLLTFQCGVFIHRMNAFYINIASFFPLSSIQNITTNNDEYWVIKFHAFDVRNQQLSNSVVL